MHIAAAANLACPIDGAPLTAEANALRCGLGHSFDLAREGYCNLLVVQHKASRDPGDSKDMVAARRRILDAGLYASIAARVFELVRALPLAPDAPSCVVDAGCGEGYYLDRLSELAAACPDPARLQLAGIDISKWAIRAAAKRKTAVTWAVASNRRLPFLPGSVDVILSMFGFPVWEGFKAVQPAGGQVLLADPGPDHLIELRSIIYPTVNRSGPPSIEAAEDSGYVLSREERLLGTASLTSAAQISGLLAMTPHIHRMTAAGREALARHEQLDVTLDVVFRVLRLIKAA